MASKAINTILNLKDNYSKTISQATSNTTKFKNTVSNVTSTLNGLKEKTTGAFGSMAKGALALGAGYVGIKSAFSYVKEGMEMAKNSELATAQLGAVLASTNNAIGMTKDQLLDLAGSYGSYTTYTKGAVLEGENLLLTFTGIGKDVLPDVTTNMIDMATAMKMDVSSSAMMLGKALNDPTAGLSKLSRQGVVFTEQQKKQIEAMQKSGDTVGAQKLMLAELQKEFGGSAKAAGETLPGKLQILKNTFNGLKKTVGEKFIPVLYDITKFATDHLPQIKAIFLTVFDNIGKVVNGAVDIFKNNLLPVFMEVWQHAEPYITKIRDLLPSAFEKVKEVAGNVFDNVKKFIDDNKESVGSFVGAFIDLAKTIWDSVSPAIENIATNLLPKLQSTFGGNSGAIKDILDKATSVFNFIKDNWKEIEPIVLTIVGALTAYKLALIAIQTWTIIVGATTSIYSAIELVIWGVVNATTAWEAIQWLLNVAMDANPIGIVIGALALLGLAIYEVVTHWQDICTWVLTTWDKLKNNPIAEFIINMNPFTGILFEIAKHFDDITSAISKAWDWLKSWIGLDVPDKNVKVNKNITTTNDGTTGNEPVNNVRPEFNATGTNYWSGKSGGTWVGEHGAELITNLPNGSKIHTASESQKMTSGGGHIFNFNFTGNVGTEEFFNKTAEYIVNKVTPILNNNM